MDPREQHINRPYHLRGECCRTSCRRVATRRIHFFSYPDRNNRNTTYACAEHAKWWVTGFHDLPLGRQEAI
jgi:hypothetical protein